MEREELNRQIEEAFENTELTLQEIANSLETTYKLVWNYVAKTYTPEARLRRKQQNYRTSKLGEKNPQHGKKYDTHYEYRYTGASGYRVIAKPDWYTGRKKSDQVHEHVIVMCELLGLTEIPRGFVIHHIDRNRVNNDPSNLALMTRAAHQRLHQLERATTIPKGSREKSRSAEQPSPRELFAANTEFTNVEGDHSQIA